MFKMRKTLALLMGVMMILSFSACGGTNQEAPKASGEVKKGSKDDGIVIGWLQKNQSNVFETVINKGGEAVLEKYKADGTIKEYYLFDGQTDPSVQINQANDMINLGVDVVILQPAEGDGSSPVVDMLTEAGIPVVEVNAMTNNVDKCAAYVGSNDVDAGEIMGRYILDTLGETGGYAHLQGIIGNSAAIQRTEGIHNILDKAPGWKMLAEQSAEWDGDKASKFTQDWIALFGKELNAIVCDNDDMSIAAKLACIEAGRDDIVVIGVDAIDSALQMVKSGELNATVFQDGAGQGAGAAEAAVKIAKGEKVEKTTMIPFQLVTKENVDNFIK